MHEAAGFCTKVYERAITIPEFLEVNKLCDTRQSAGLYLLSIQSNPNINPFSLKQLESCVMQYCNFSLGFHVFFLMKG